VAGSMTHIECWRVNEGSKEKALFSLQNIPDPVIGIKKGAQSVFQRKYNNYLFAKAK